MSDVAAATHAAASKTTPVDTDELGYLNSAAGFALVKMNWGNLKTWLGGLFVSKSGDTVGGNLQVTGNVLITGSGGLGYGTGAGGTVTQLTSKSTAVTLNNPTGQITMNGAALSGGGSVAFYLSNSNIGAADVLAVSLFGGGSWVDNYTVRAGCYAGGARLVLRNETGSSLSDAVQILFVVVKGSAS